MASRRLGRTWLLAALIGTAPVACLFSPEPPPGPCKGDSKVCDDGNPCTFDVCDADGFCANEQDDSLVPNDGNPCTEDRCFGGVAQISNAPDGTKCGASDQLTCTAGKCHCTTAADCGVDEDCLTFACADEECQAINVAAGTVIDGAGTGDCLQNVCDGSGKRVLAPDPTDFPADPTPGDCQKKGCSAEGTAVNVPEVNDVPADGSPGDCKAPACSAAGILIEEPSPADVPSGETPGDCKTPGCDANGNVIDVEDTTDVPLDDGNLCTDEGCNGMSPIEHLPVPDDTPCGAPASCGPSGIEYAQTTAETCQSGLCTMGTTQSCGLYTCNGAACHVTCSGAAECAMGAFCQGGFCKPLSGLGSGCSTSAECLSMNCSDGVCCNVACKETCQTCTLPGQVGVCGNIPSGTDPENECAGAQVCDGAGECKQATGTACSADDDCLTDQCEDGVCCNASCAGDCLACDQAGSVGTCQLVPLGQTSDSCDGNNACDGNGDCKLANGQVCFGGPNSCASGFCPFEGFFDVCCDTACDDPCTSCRAAKTGGTEGVCGYILDGTDPDFDCSGGTCNGMGACNP
jgi:hypothetical protein